MKFIILDHRDGGQVAIKARLIEGIVEEDNGHGVIYTKSRKDAIHVKSFSQAIDALKEAVTGVVAEKLAAPTPIKPVERGSTYHWVMSSAKRVKVRAHERDGKLYLKAADGAWVEIETKEVEEAGYDG